MDSFIKVATVGDVPEGGMIGVSAGDAEVLLARIDDKYYAINNICSHFHTQLSNGELHAARLEVQCPLHDSCFSLVSGEPIEPPAEDPVETYEVRVEGRDILVGPKPAA